MNYTFQVNFVFSGKAPKLLAEKVDQSGWYLNKPGRIITHNELAFLDKSPDYWNEDFAVGVRGPLEREWGHHCEMLVFIQ